jgi:hypothetical protein
MAGGFLGKTNPKNQKLGKFFNSEVLQDSREPFAPKNTENSQKVTLKGILGLGQTVELGRQNQQAEHQNKEIFNQINHLQHEENVLFNQHQKELQRTLEGLREDIQKLASATNNLEKDVENVVISPITEVNEYQLNFFNRIRIFISNMRQNINQAGVWMEAFSAKKKKRNIFWNNVKNKKKGGEQYLFSEEHSSARSVS